MSIITKTSSAAPAKQGELVIVLPCSGGGAQFGQRLARSLDPEVTVFAHDDMAEGPSSRRSGEQSLQLADEARPLIALIDSWQGPVHLVGHSYGGAVALRIAVERPTRIASLSLYEPAAFHVLRTCGDDGRVAFREIRAVAQHVGSKVAAGAYRAAARRFIDYWHEPGAFDRIDGDAQGRLAGYMPNVCPSFHALFTERTPLIAYRRLRTPLLLMCGEHAPATTRLVGRKLASAINPGALRMVTGAGHMGPFTHADLVCNMILENIGVSPVSVVPLSLRRAA